MADRVPRSAAGWAGRVDRGTRRLAAVRRHLEEALVAVDRSEQERLLVDAAASATGAAGDFAVAVMRRPSGGALAAGMLRDTLARARDGLALLHMQLQLQGVAVDGRLGGALAAIGEGLDDVQEMLAEVARADAAAIDAAAAAMAAAAASFTGGRADSPAERVLGGAGPQSAHRGRRSRASVTAATSRSPGSRPSGSGPRWPSRGRR